MALEAQKRVEEDREDGTEDQNCLRVALPVLVALGIDAEQAIEAAFGSAEEAQPAAAREATVGVHPGHVEAERVREHHEDDRVKDDLGDALPAHLELLPAEERVDEVDEDGDRDDQPEDVGRRHQTRPNAHSRTNAKAKQAAAMPIAARSYITHPLGERTRSAAASRGRVSMFGLEYSGLFASPSRSRTSSTALRRHGSRKVADALGDAGEHG